MCLISTKELFFEEDLTFIAMQKYAHLVPLPLYLPGPGGQLSMRCDSSARVVLLFSEMGRGGRGAFPLERVVCYPKFHFL